MGSNETGIFRGIRCTNNSHRGHKYELIYLIQRKIVPEELVPVTVWVIVSAHRALLN
jgi:hypothetical protein